MRKKINFEIVNPHIETVRFTKHYILFTIIVLRTRYNGRIRSKTFFLYEHWCLHACHQRLTPSFIYAKIDFTLFVILFNFFFFFFLKRKFTLQIVEFNYTRLEKTAAKR